jgi:hypothetical protein
MTSKFILKLMELFPKKINPVELVNNTLNHNRTSPSDWLYFVEGIRVLETNGGMLFTLDNKAYVVSKGFLPSEKIRGQFDIREITPKTVKTIDMGQTWDNIPFINNYGSDIAIREVTEQSRPLSGEESRNILDRLGYKPKAIYHELHVMPTPERDAFFTELGFDKSELSDRT